MTMTDPSVRTAPDSDYDLRILSLGAGTQSSALLMLAIREELDDKYLPLDAAIFADVGDEPREVYDWLKVLQREAAGKVPIHVVRGPSGRLSEHAVSLDSEHNRLDVPAFIDKPGGGIARRKCTRDFKVTPIKRKIRDLLDAKTGSRSTRGRKVLQLIGMSLDEVERMKPSGVAYIDHCWPLVEMKWRRQSAINYIEGLDLGTPPRSACVFCPYHSNHEWRRIRDNDPEGWAAAVRFDDLLREANREWQRRGSTTAYDGDLYLHRSLVPLAEVDLRTIEDHGQLDMFTQECEGMCGA